MELTKIISSVAIMGAVSLAICPLSASAISFQVTASISTECTVDTASDLGFGQYDPVAPVPTSNKDTTSSIHVFCSDEQPAEIKLDGGLNGSISARNMKLTTGSDLLSYQLYKDASRTNIWGDTPETLLVGNPGTGGESYTVYGRIPSGQTGASGDYSDTINATANFAP